MEERDLAAQFIWKMRHEGLPEYAVRQFCTYYHRLMNNEAGYICGEVARPVDTIPSYLALGDTDAAAGRTLLNKVAIWKLNGGLGTSLGLHGAKTALPAKGPFSFLEITIQQVLHQRERDGARLPLILMESGHGSATCTSQWEERSAWAQDLPLRYAQHRIPKVRADNLMPVSWPEDPEKEWCPPGHGDLFTSLAHNGALAEMLAAGYEYAFVSNGDNLGAVVDPRILGYVAQRQLPFLMEVTTRTQADHKGGHLACRPDGRFMLREVAQCPPEEEADFQDIQRYRYFNTNTLWIHLPSLQRLLAEQGGALTLPLIRNRKRVDPRNLHSPPVYHLETAIGAAIELFPEAEALVVPRSRFIPVKRTHDLLLLWSDAYRLTHDFRLRLATRGVGFEGYAPPIVELDPHYYRTVQEVQRHFPFGAPSLADCRSFRVTGDVYFGRDVVIKGWAHVINERPSPMWIPDGAVLSGEIRRQIGRTRPVQRPQGVAHDIYMSIFSR